MAAAFLEFCSNWMRLITLCENITLFWSSGPDWLSVRLSTIRLPITVSSTAIYYETYGQNSLTITQQAHDITMTSH